MASRSVRRGRRIVRGVASDDRGPAANGAARTTATDSSSGGCVMKQTYGRLILAVTAALLLPVMTTAQTPDTRPGVAVLPFMQGISIGAEKETLDALSVGL